ncbi:hypothetical protein FTUN_0283 [Frigoriglobus tundricola]|uniref:Uncharacterized protein n=1 Tax=Frigoriglobus tundricola TaxID=2774151 RepID=A0A6M5YHP2_9BACT|nr:hypothetical protein FTUN_0283 [Frigoriglobus tundricola]
MGHGQRSIPYCILGLFAVLPLLSRLTCTGEIIDNLTRMGEMGESGQL